MYETCLGEDLATVSAQEIPVIARQEQAHAHWLKKQKEMLREKY